MVTVDKVALRELVERFQEQQENARRALATFTNIEAAPAGLPMRDMSDWHRSHLESEIGAYQDAIDGAMAMLNA